MRRRPTTPSTGLVVVRKTLPAQNCEVESSGQGSSPESNTEGESEKRRDRKVQQAQVPRSNAPRWKEIEPNLLSTYVRLPRFAVSILPDIYYPVHGCYWEFPERANTPAAPYAKTAYECFVVLLPLSEPSRGFIYPSYGRYPLFALQGCSKNLTVLHFSSLPLFVNGYPLFAPNKHFKELVDDCSGNKSVFRDTLHASTRVTHEWHNWKWLAVLTLCTAPSVAFWPQAFNGCTCQTLVRPDGTFENVT
ncbi:hypothetical protein BKA63DRAFT_210321 [Paraphoma chrysanthemicola]|nr:hypothetical protein BKA63DRAFT_210321 [Paraphoma chrysanthemicola]